MLSLKLWINVLKINLLIYKENKSSEFIKQLNLLNSWAREQEISWIRLCMSRDTYLYGLYWSKGNGVRVSKNLLG